MNVLRPASCVVLAGCLLCLGRKSPANERAPAWGLEIEVRALAGMTRPIDTQNNTTDDTYLPLESLCLGLRLRPVTLALCGGWSRFLSSGLTFGNESWGTWVASPAIFVPVWRPTPTTEIGLRAAVAFGASGTYWSDSFHGVRGAAAGRYFVSPNLALGIELGVSEPYVAPYVSGPPQDYVQVSAYGAITIAFVAGPSLRASPPSGAPRLGAAPGAPR